MRESISEKGKHPEISDFVIDKDVKIRKNLRRIRLAKSIKVVDIAKCLNISTNQYSNLESGKSKLNLIQLFTIIESLDCPLNKVFNFVDDDNKSLIEKINQLQEDMVQLKDHNRLLMKEIQNRVRS